MRINTRLALFVLGVLALFVALAIAQTHVEVNPTISCGGGCGSTATTQQSGCPCRQEIKEACGGEKTNGPDFDNDPNWRFIGMANFMNEARIKELEEITPSGVDLEYSLERERPVAVSPEGRMYMWQGPITSFGDALEGPELPHFGVDTPSTRPVPGELPPGPCMLLNELPLGRSTVSGNGALLGELPGATITGAAFTQVTGEQVPFPIAGFEVAAGPVVQVNAAIKISFRSPRFRAVVIQGLRPIDRTVNFGVNSGQYLYVGTSWPNATAPAATSGIELRSATVGDPVGLVVLSSSPIRDLLIGHFAFSSICMFEDIDEFLNLPFLYNLPASTVPRSVIGTDSRVRHTPTTGYPLRTMGAIHSPTGDVHYCSGAKVGPRHFLTAGHCMFDKDTKMWIPNAKIWFGQNGDGAGLPPPASQAPFGIKHHVWYYTTKGWLEDGDWKYDYGMIVLQDTKATVSLGWLGYSSDSSKSDEGTTVNLRGHPGSNQFCEASPNADDRCRGFLYGDAGTIYDQSSYHLYYKIDTNKGNSGSNVYYYNGVNRYVVGVHAYGNNGDGFNKAVRVRPAVFDNIKAWKNQWPSAFD